MRYSLCLTVLLISVRCAVPQLSQSKFESRWQSLKVRKTTADDAIYLFGVPDYVQTDMEYQEFLNHQQRPGRLVSYSLMYVPLRKDLTILDGPLGKASSASLHFQNGSLSSAEWTYFGSKMVPAYANWMADDALELGRNGHILISAKPVAGATLYVHCYEGEKPLPCNGEMRVSLGERQNKITRSLARWKAPAKKQGSGARS